MLCRCVLKHTIDTFCVFWNSCVYHSDHNIPVHPIQFQFICISAIQSLSIALSRLAKTKELLCAGQTALRIAVQIAYLKFSKAGTGAPVTLAC